MESVQSTQTLGATQSVRSTSSAANNQSFWDRLFKGELEHNRFAIISMVLLVVGCVGGIVMWSGAVNSVWQMILTVFPTMTVLSLLLSVQPMKWILNTMVVALIIDITLIIYNLAM